MLRGTLCIMASLAVVSCGEPPPPRASFAAPTRLVETRFSCRSSGYSKLSETDNRSDIIASGWLTLDEVIAVKIDEKAGTVRIVSPTSLELGHIDGTTMTIGFKNDNVLFASGSPDETMASLMIDKTSSRMIWWQAGRLAQSGKLHVLGRHYQCNLK